MIIGIVASVAAGDIPIPADPSVFPEMLEEFVSIDSVMILAAFTVPDVPLVGIVNVTELLELTFSEQSDWQLLNHI